MDRSGKRSNVYDLYRERENEAWYWAVLGTVAWMLIALGFLLFPTSFPGEENAAAAENGSGSRSTLSIISVILLAIGYSLSVALWFICRSWLFQLNVLFLPCLYACILGAINVGIHLGSSASPVQWAAAPVSALALAGISSSIYAVLCFFTYRKIDRIRSISNLSSPPREHSHSESATLITEEDQTRKNFSQLLGRGDRWFGAYGASPAATYHIDMPDRHRMGRSEEGAYGNINYNGSRRSTSPYSESSYNGYGADAGTTGGQMGSLPPRHNLSNMPSHSTMHTTYTSPTPNSTLSHTNTLRSAHTTNSLQRSSGGPTQASSLTVSSQQQPDWIQSDSASISNNNSNKIQTTGLGEGFPGAATRLEGKAAALQAARERAEHNQRSRDRMAQGLAAARGSSQQQRTQAHGAQFADGSDLGAGLGGVSLGIALEERHPLDRDEINREHRGSAGSDRKGVDVYHGPTYRPDSSQSETPGDGGEESWQFEPARPQEARFEIIEGEDVRFDIGEMKRMKSMRHQQQLASHEYRDMQHHGRQASDGTTTGGRSSNVLRVGELEARMPRVMGGPSGRDSYFSDDGTEDAGTLTGTGHWTRQVESGNETGRTRAGTGSGDTNEEGSWRKGAER